MNEFHHLHVGLLIARNHFFRSPEFFLWMNPCCIYVLHEERSTFNKFSDFPDLLLIDYKGLRYRQSDIVSVNPRGQNVIRLALFLQIQLMIGSVFLCLIRYSVELNKASSQITNAKLRTWVYSQLICINWLNYIVI